VAINEHFSDLRGIDISISDERRKIIEAKERCLHEQERVFMEGEIKKDCTMVYFLYRTNNCKKPLVTISSSLNEEEIGKKGFIKYLEEEVTRAREVDRYYLVCGEHENLQSIWVPYYSDTTYLSIIPYNYPLRVMLYKYDQENGIIPTRDIYIRGFLK